MRPKKHNIIYRTTNTVNGMFYIGCHETDELADGYLGSGKYLKRAVTKYGIGAFLREVLFDFTTRTEMFAKEKELVTEEFVRLEQNYNIGVGGKGGFFHITPEQRMKTYRKNLTREVCSANGKKTGSANMKAHHEAGKIRYDTFTGRQHTEETKEKMRKSKNVGSANSQFGTMWITNGSENRKIKKDLDSIPEGWYKGRQMARPGPTPVKHRPR